MKCLIAPNIDGVHVKARPADWKRILDELAARYTLPDPRSLPRRILERALAAAVLAITFPVMLLVALAIRLDSPGPALFRQKRVGRGGRLFDFVKFRSLYHDARRRFPELYAYQYTLEEIEQLCFKVPNDPRVTRAGEWLRRTTLDELPNFWNVLTGDMALVGPRPEIPEMLPYYRDEHLIKFSVPPGVTGLAQISGRGRLRFLETARLDAQYAANRSLRVDLQILVRTLSLILRQDGAF
jgi:lipopolysaccharide/colanic/teichoic acid biosynthesis glycosyltransferase